MLEKLLTLLKKIVDLFLNDSNESEIAVQKDEPEQKTEQSVGSEQKPLSEQPIQQLSKPLESFDTTWNYGYWKEASTYAEI